MMEFISEIDIVSLFNCGLSVKMLINKVAGIDRVSKSVAQMKVESAIYHAVKKCTEF